MSVITLLGRIKKPQEKLKSVDKQNIEGQFIVASTYVKRPVSVQFVNLVPVSEF